MPKRQYARKTGCGVLSQSENKGFQCLIGRRPLASGIATLLLGLVLLSGYAFAGNRNDYVRQLEKFREFFISFQQSPDNSIPTSLLSNCKGIIIMRQFKAGFVFGARGGYGVALIRDPITGSWTPPAFLYSGEGSFGFQIGGQAVEAIFLIMNDDGMRMLMNTRFKIGVGASAVAGPVGRDAAAQVGIDTAILAYSRAKGLFAGLSFEGGGLISNDEANRLMYGRPVTVKEILFEQAVEMPPEALPLIETLTNAAGIPVLAQPIPEQIIVVEPVSQQPVVAQPAPDPLKQQALSDLQPLPDLEPSR